MRYVLIVFLGIYLSSAWLASPSQAQSEGWGQTYSQQKEVRRVVKRSKRYYRRSYRRTRIVVRPRVVRTAVTPTINSFEKQHEGINYLIPLPEKTSYRWDVPVQHVPYMYIKQDTEARQEVSKWKRLFFGAIGIILLFHLALLLLISFYYARVGKTYTSA